MEAVTGHQRMVGEEGILMPNAVVFVEGCEGQEKTVQWGSHRKEGKGDWRFVLFCHDRN